MASGKQSDEDEVQIVYPEYDKLILDVKQRVQNCTEDIDFSSITPNEKI